jgi:hypothetical protein
MNRQLGRNPWFAWREVMVFPFYHSVGASRQEAMQAERPFVPFGYPFSGESCLGLQARIWGFP